MGQTIDVLRGNVAVYVTCDGWGLSILGPVRVDPAAGVRDYERYEHADGCPGDDTPSAPEGGA